MNMLILDETAQEALEELNDSGDPTLQLVAIPLVNDDAALTAALLTDCNEGDTWDHYGDFLEALPEMEVTPEMIDEPAIS